MNEPARARASRIADAALAPSGHQRIDWARRRSPVLDGFVRRRLGSELLRGRRVAVVVHLEAKTAFLATVLAEAGAEVIVAGSNPWTTRDDVAAALVERGIEVHSSRRSTMEVWEADLAAVAAAEPEFIIDDGAELTVRMERDHPSRFARLRGVSEETTTGVARLRTLDAAGRLPFPAIAANDAACKHMFDNRYGTGQSTIQAVLQLTNLRLPGKRVAIVGYGWVGRGIATYARALGARVVAVETDPIRALEAHTDGHDVADLPTALAGAEIVITATGGMRSIAAEQIAHLRSGAVLANAGHHDLEIDVPALREAASAVDEPRPGVTRYRIDGRSVYVLSDGALVNIAGGLGHPVEIMDLSFSVQAMGLHTLVIGELPAGVHDLPAAVDREIAAAKLSSRDTPRPNVDSHQDRAPTMGPHPDENPNGGRGAQGGIAGAGERGSIEFAGEFMPALAAATGAARRSGALAGRRVGVALTLEPKTACLAEALASIGADVAVLGNNHSTRPEVAAALADGGLRVFAEAGASDGRVAELRDAFIDTAVEYLADDGAGITRRIHGDRRDMLAHLRGVAEETTSGVRPLRNMAAEGALAVPCVAVNDARTKLRFDNLYGTGQSVVMAVLDVTNMQMAGARVVVAGYGKVGRGIAAVARGLGARVTVTEIDPVEALRAYHDGNDVAPLREAVASADFVFTASGIGHTLTADDLAVMPDGCVVAVGGAGPPELDLTIGPELELGEEVRPHVRAVTVPSGATVFVVADGYCANTSAGEGNPIEVMDLSLALQMRALDHLAATDLAPGVHLLPAAIDDEVAASQLAACGIRIDTPTGPQLRAARSW